MIRLMFYRFRSVLLVLALTATSACFGQASVILVNRTGADLLVYPVWNEPSFDKICFTPLGGAVAGPAVHPLQMNLFNRINLVTLGRGQTFEVSRQSPRNAPARNHFLISFRIESCPDYSGPFLGGIMSFCQATRGGKVISEIGQDEDDEQPDNRIVIAKELDGPSNEYIIFSRRALEAKQDPEPSLKAKPGEPQSRARTPETALEGPTQGCCVLQ